MASQHTVRIEPLGKDNYDTWRIQMEALLVKSDSWSIVNGEEAKPEAVEGNPNATAARAAWEKADRTAKSDIILAISPSELKLIKGCATSHALWMKLQATYQSAGPARKASLLKKLTLHRMGDGEDVHNHLRDFFDTVDKLGEMDIEVNPDLLTVMLLYSLPPAFENFRCAIESRDALPTPEALRIKIIEEADARRGDLFVGFQTPKALAAKITRAKRGQLDQSKPKTKRDERRDSKRVDLSRIKCYRCKRFGHKAIDCGKSRGNDEVTQKVENLSMFASLDFSPPQNAFEIKSAPEREKWCLDSGCSTHLCRDMRDFSEISKIAHGTLNLATKASAEIKARGTISFTGDVNGVTKQVSVKDTLHVPDLRTNLLSVGKITDRGYKVIFDKLTAKIVDKRNNKTVLIADRKNELYYIRESKSECCAAIKNEDRTLKTWHRKMGHLNVRDLMKCVRAGDVRGIEIDDATSDLACEVCARGKMTRAPFPKRTERKSGLLEIVHTDVCGPMRTESIGRGRYFVIFIDDHSKWCEVRVIREKNQAFEAFKEFKAYAEKQTGKQIKHLQSDNGKEYCNSEFDAFLKEHGIGRRLATTHTPEQNGVAERRNRTLVEMARCLLIQSRLPPSFWAEAINTANYIRNRCPSSSLNGKTPFEAWTGKQPDVSHFRSFGQNVYVLNRDPRKGKFDDRSKKGIFLGYSEVSKAYRVWISDERRVDISRDIKFLDISEDTIADDFEDFYDGKEESTTKNELSVEIELCPNKTVTEIREEDTVSEEEEEAIEELVEDRPRRGPGRPRLLRTGLRGRPKKVHYPVRFAGEECANLAEIPTKMALGGPEKNLWMDAMKSELEAILTKGTWVIVDRPKNQQTIGSRFVLRNKFKSDGTLEKRKARLVARGFSQRPGIDYGDTFAPVARIGSIRLVASLAARLGLELRQFDITTAYLNGNLTEDVYMEPPKHIEEVLEEIVSSSGKSCLRSAASKTLEQLQLGDKVFLLKKALYGLRQAGRCWYERLRAILYKFNLIQSACDPCVFYLGERENLVIVIIYVDDIIVAARKDCDTAGRLYAHLSEDFEVKDLGLAKYCLGIEFSQEEGKITMNQRGYIDDLLKRFGMVDSKPVATPMSQGTNLARNEKIESTQVDVPYRELVGALMYLSVCYQA